MRTISGNRFLAASMDIACWLGKPLVDGGKGPIKTLIIDDETFYADMLAGMLSKVSGTKYVPETVSDVQEAEDLIMLGIHDIYVVDYHLDIETTGIDLVKRCQSKGRHFPFCMITGDETIIDHPAFERDCMGWFLKTQLVSPATVDKAFRYLYKNWLTRCKFSSAHTKFHPVAA